MNDKDLYAQILGIVSPWEVSEVDLNLLDSEIRIRIIYKSRKGICPDCGQEYSVHDYREERSWRHLDTCQMTTTLSSKLPRIKCPKHGVKTITSPWSESNSRTTMQFERFAIDLLLASKNQTKASEILRVSFDVLHHIMEKAVERGLLSREERDIKYIGIDEKSMKKGHNYITVLSDTKGQCVIEVEEARTQIATQSLLNKGLTEKQKQQIKGVSLDMWQGFMNAVKEELPEASIVHDKFHIIKYLNDAVDKTRRAESKQLQKKNDQTLIKTKYIFLKKKENMTENQLTRFQQIQEMNLKTSQAWVAKENFKEFFNSKTINEGKFFFAEWYHDVKERSLTKMIKVGKMLVKHSDGLLNYIKHPINNAIAEWLNGKIQEIKTIGRGFRNFKNFRIAILFFLGKLKLHPQTSQ
jgi:transposase